MAWASNGRSFFGRPTGVFLGFFWAWLPMAQASNDRSFFGCSAGVFLVFFWAWQMGNLAGSEAVRASSGATCDLARVRPGEPAAWDQSMFRASELSRQLGVWLPAFEGRGECTQQLTAATRQQRHFQQLTQLHSSSVLHRWGDRFRTRVEESWPYPEGPSNARRLQQKEIRQAVVEEDGGLVEEDGGRPDRSLLGRHGGGVSVTSMTQCVLGMQEPRPWAASNGLGF